MPALLLAGCGGSGWEQPRLNATPIDPTRLPPVLATATGQRFTLGAPLDTAGLTPAPEFYPDHLHTYLRGNEPEATGELVIVSSDSLGATDFIEIRYPVPQSYDAMADSARRRYGEPSREWPGRRAEWRAGTHMLVIQRLAMRVPGNIGARPVEALLWRCQDACR